MPRLIGIKRIGRNHDDCDIMSRQVRRGSP
jgi:hypothetical protein